MAWKAIIDWPDGSSTLNANINDATETIVLASDPGTAMSAADFWVRVGYEQIYVATRAGDTLTCTGGRGANGTVAAAHFAGDAVVQDFFAAHITEIRDVIDAMNPLEQATLAVGGGYGDTGCTIAGDGNISTNGTLTVDGNISTNGILTVDDVSTLTGAVTAPHASNAIRIGTSCDLTTPPAIGGTTQNTIKGTTFEATGATFATPATFTFAAAATALTIGMTTGTCTIRNATLALSGYQWNSGAALLKHYDRAMAFAASAWYEICTITVTGGDYYAAGLHIEFNASSFSTAYGSWQADAYVAHTTSTSYYPYISWRGVKNTYNVKMRDMGSNVYAIWAYGPASCAGAIRVTYRENSAGLVSFANFGVAPAAGSADIAEVGTFTFSNPTVALAGYGTTIGGFHVGGTSDPGTDNLIVDGTSTLTGIVTLAASSMITPATFTFGAAATTLNIGAATGTMTVNNTTLAAKAVTCSTTLGVTGVVTATAVANVINIGSSCTMTIPPIIGGGTPNIGYFSTLTASTGLYSYNGVLISGISGTTRGTLLLFHGADGNTAGYIKMYSRNGTANYLWFEDDGTLKQSTAIPVLNADGNVVGAQT